MRAAAVVIALIFVAHANADDDALTARQIINLAVQANGGEAWKAPHTLMLAGDMTIYREGEHAESVHVDDYRMWRAFPAQNVEAHAANGKVRFDARKDGRTVFQISFDGNHTYNQDGRVADPEADKRWSENFGFGIIRFVDRDGFKVTRMADDTVDGHACHFVQVTDLKGGKTVFAIDQKGFEVRYVGFDTPRGWHHRIYDDFAWHEHPAFRQPRHVRLYYNGVLTNDIRWPDFEVNGDIPRGTFDLSVTPERTSP